MVAGQQEEVGILVDGGHLIVGYRSDEPNCISKAETISELFQPCTVAERVFASDRQRRSGNALSYLSERVQQQQLVLDRNERSGMQEPRPSDIVCQSFRCGREHGRVDRQWHAPGATSSISTDCPRKIEDVGRSVGHLIGHREYPGDVEQVTARPHVPVVDRRDVSDLLPTDACNHWNSKKSTGENSERSGFV